VLSRHLLSVFTSNVPDQFIIKLWTLENIPARALKPKNFPDNYTTNKSEGFTTKGCSLHYSILIGYLDNVFSPLE
jgi:hypothetical protein